MPHLHRHPGCRPLSDIGRPPADTVLRDYFLRIGASVLRRRNRYKHFYVFTVCGLPASSARRPQVAGNTNGGKSLLLSLLKQALGPLCGQMAISALTTRESDPSGHNDYLARTQGMAFVMCHEPDALRETVAGWRETKVF